MKQSSFSHEFVEFIPSMLDDGILYVSIPYATVVHLCACGCGNKVVTPINPAQWQLLYDGESVSLSPSLGNWQFPCRSHYWVRHDQIRWARPWTDEEIAEGHRRDAQDLESYFTGRYIREDDISTAEEHPSRSILYRILQLLGLR